MGEHQPIFAARSVFTVRRSLKPQATAPSNLEAAFAVDSMKHAGSAGVQQKAMKNGQPFLTDVQQLRDKARESIEQGAVTPTYSTNVKQTIDILQTVLATELVCVLRYTMNAVAATGLASESVKEEFDQHAKEEQEHMRAVAERINQLGGVPNFNPEGLASRAASQYSETKDLIEMIKENLIAERIACEHYRELIRYFADKDPTTRVMMESILTNEEEHASDMHDLLVAHDGKRLAAGKR